MASKRTRSRVKVVTQVPQLDAELKKASDRLVVLEFFSEKCDASQTPPLTHKTISTVSNKFLLRKSLLPASIAPCRKMQEAIAALSLEHTSAVFVRANMDLWEVSATPSLCVENANPGVVSFAQRC